LFDILLVRADYFLKNLENKLSCVNLSLESLPHEDARVAPARNTYNLYEKNISREHWPLDGTHTHWQLIFSLYMFVSTT